MITTNPHSHILIPFSFDWRTAICNDILSLFEALDIHLNDAFDLYDPTPQDDLELVLHLSYLLETNVPDQKRNYILSLLDLLDDRQTMNDGN